MTLQPHSETVLTELVIMEVVWYVEQLGRSCYSPESIILMAETGHSIRHFKDLPELVRVARDAMEGD